MKEPMKLEIKNEGIRGARLVLDGKELHHVKGYEIKSSTFAGKVELSLKMLVTFPVVTDEKPEEPSGKTIKTTKTTKQIADEIFEYLKKERLTANKAWDAISEVRRRLHEAAYSSRL